MAEEVKHLIRSILGGLAVIAVGGLLVNSKYAISFSFIVAFAWVAWKVVDYVSNERNRNE